MEEMYDFTQAKCLLCGNTGADFVSRVRDTDDHWIVKCKGCGHVQLSPLPTVEQEEEYYKTNRMARDLLPQADKNDFDLMMKYEIWGAKQAARVKKNFPAGSRLVEIGSGYGWFVEKMRSDDYYVCGLDINEEKCAMAKERAGIELQPLNFITDEIFPDMLHSFDGVCSFHVLEHMPDPKMMLMKASQFLKPGGRIYLEVPNLNDYVKGLSNEYTNFSYLRAHLSYFSPETLRSTLERAGYSGVTVGGVQDYGLENAIHWIRNGTPFLDYCQWDLPEGLEWINQYYKQELERKLISGALFASAVWDG